MKLKRAIGRRVIAFPEHVEIEHVREALDFVCPACPNGDQGVAHEKFSVNGIVILVALPFQATTNAAATIRSGMQPLQVVELITRRAAESNPGFRAEIERLSRRGLLVIAGIESGLTTLGIVAQFAGIPYPHEGGPQAWAIASFWTLAIAAYFAARSAVFAPYARAAAWTTGLVTAFLLSLVDLQALRQYTRVPIELDLLTVLLVALATVPATPLQMFALGGLSLGNHLLLASLTRQWGWSTGYDPFVPPLAILVLLCTVLAGVNYGRIHSGWRAHQEAVEAAEAARQSELRSCHADNAATTLRLAAAISHEFNSPLGTLKSSAETVRKTASLAPPSGPRGVREEALVQLGDAMSQAVARLEAMVRRMQRFTNLDRSEVQIVDFRQMIEDVIQLQTPPDGGGTRFDLNFPPVPRFQAPAQPLTGLFSTLMRRAIDGAGPDGRVEVQADLRDSVLCVSIGHSGAPAGSSDLEFTVRNGRVGTGNWDIFSARQVVQSFGGDLVADSSNGAWLRVTVPVKVLDAALAAAVAQPGIVRAGI